MAAATCIRGRGIRCAAGNSPREVCDNVYRGNVIPSRVKLHRVVPSVTRPFYFLHGHRSPPANPASILFDTIAGAVEDAVREAGYGSTEMAECALFAGSTSMGISAREAHWVREREEGPAPVGEEPGSLTEQLAQQFGIGGMVFTFATACTSSANALLHAHAMILRGRIDKALVVGFEMFNETTLYGFESLKLIASESYAPFDARRGGIILGEGCAAVILQREGPPPHFGSILGGANLCDVSGLATNDESGCRIGEVMQRAADNCGIGVERIACVKAHATGSEANDLSEAKGIRQAFGGHLPPVTGIKGYLGHTLGGAGVIELVIMSMTHEQGYVPATAGFARPDTEFGLTPIAEHIPSGGGPGMLNYFGFGGNCTSLVVSFGGAA